MAIEDIVHDPILKWFRDRPRAAHVLAARKSSKPLLGPRSRLGGFPFLPSASKWPDCTRCGTSLFFVGQFGKDLENLPLPNNFDLLSIFKCSNKNCEFWFNRFGGAPFFRLFDTSKVSAVQSPDRGWRGKSIYPPPGIKFDKFGPTNNSITAEVGLPFSITVGEHKVDYPGWEECPSWRKMNDSVFYEYMELRPIEG